MSLAIIPARGGSKGVPRKNLQIVGGKPLIQWTIDAALKAGMDAVFVSTEDHEIAQVALQGGARIIERPEEYATDNIHAFMPLMHALDFLNVPDDEQVFMLLPTSPLRSAHDIQCGRGLLEPGQTVVGVTDAGPALSIRIMGQFYIHPIAPFSEVMLHKQRQVTDNFYKVNGALFAGHANTLREFGTFHIDRCIGYRMPLSRSIDVNDQTDLFLADTLLKSMNVA